MNCRCGGPAGEDGKCDRCRYYQSVFRPPPSVFESKREKAKRAIWNRKMMGGIVRWV